MRTPVLILRASLAQVGKQLDDGVLGGAGHPHRGLDAVALDEASNDLRALLGAQPVHIDYLLELPDGITAC